MAQSFYTSPVGEPSRILKRFNNFKSKHVHLGLIVYLKFDL